MSKKVFITILMVSAIVLSIWFGWYNLKFNQKRLVFCDVGQGNGVILSKGNFQLVYDVGPDNGKFLNCISNNMPFWDRKIEVVVISHWDSDHSGGLQDLKSHYQLESLYLSKTNKDYSEVTVLNKGDKLENDWMSFETIWTLEGEDDNYGSVVGLLGVRDYKALLMGDVPVEVEQRLLWSELIRNEDMGQGIKGVDVMLVGHHGSESSNSQEWLEYVKPKTVVISVGKNSYGHPSRKVIDILGKLGVEVLRTDMGGEIEIKL